MIWKKFGSRNLYILETLEISSVNEDILLKKLAVSKKTLTNDIKQLNIKLENCAFIDVKSKEVSLFVYDYLIYKKVVSSIRLSLIHI